MKHGKSYGSPSERTYRLAIFYKNLLRLAAEKMTAKSYTVALNEFSDLTKKEFLTKHTGYRFVKKARKETYLQPSQEASVNWVEKGAVVAIKNQGQCGSCWAFSTIVATEAAYQIAGNPLTSLSEQQLVDCSGAYGNHGCNGGWMDNAFKYIRDNGIQSETAYPYTAVQGRCKGTGTPITKVSGYTDVPRSNNDQLKAAVTKTVVSIAIDAYGIMQYKSGVFDGSCGTALNHGVAIVGYGNEDSKDYWLVRNSWGQQWGEKGYFKLIRTTGESPGICGLALAASYPTI